MPILTIGEIVNNELSQMNFQFGGTPADVVEYSDGGRKASGQAITVSGLDVVANNWGYLEPDVVPIADGNGMIPAFYGPKGILALRVDFGYGEVILRADAAGLHKELRDILLARLSQLQVDNDSFRTAVTGELDAMRDTIDNAVSDALSEVEGLIDEALGDTIEDAVAAKLATDLGPTLEAAVNAALADEVPDLIEDEVNSKVPPAVASATSSLSSRIDDVEDDVNSNGVSIAGVRYDLDATKARVTSAENRIQSQEILTTIQSWTKTATLSDAVVTLKLKKFQGIVFGFLMLTARSSNGGATGWVDRSGMGIPAAFLPHTNGEANTMASVSMANGTIQPEANYRIGLTTDGLVYSQGYESWDVLRATLLYST